MTQEQKAKTYEEALERAKQLLETSVAYDRFTIEKIFPELKESEDERTRKDIKRAISVALDYSFFDKENADNCLAWLEKQKSVGEIVLRCKNSWYNEGKIQGQIEGLSDEEKYQQGWHDALENQGEQKPDDKVEPKFRPGDWIVYNRIDSSEILYVYDIRDGRYYFNDMWHFSWSVKECDENCHLWTIQDAKDGDLIYVSTEVKGIQAIFREYKDKTIFFHCYLCRDFAQDGYMPIGNVELVYPLQKTHYERFFEKMKEAGYTFDFEKKELKESEQKSLQWNISDYKTWQYIVSDVLTLHDGIGQYLDDGFCKNIAKNMQEEWSKKLSLGQKSTWSEEDEKNLQKAVWYIENPALNVVKDIMLSEWLKSIKQRIKDRK